MKKPRCGKWMPRAKQFCAGPMNHSGDCRTKQRVANDIARYCDYKRDRYNNDETFRTAELQRMREGRETAKISNPQDYRKRIAVSNAKQSAKESGVPFNLTVATVPDIPEYCPVFGVRLNLTPNADKRPDDCPSLDRVIPELGYIASNVVWICWRANRLKNNATLRELEQLTNYVKSQCEVL